MSLKSTSSLTSKSPEMHTAATIPNAMATMQIETTSTHFTERRSQGESFTLPYWGVSTTLAAALDHTRIVDNVASAGILTVFVPRK